MKRRYNYIYAIKAADPMMKRLLSHVDTPIIDVGRNGFWKYPDRFADGCLVARGLRDGIAMNAAKERGMDFFYIETGYFGNLNSYYVRNIVEAHLTKKKVFHRVVKNGLQHTEIIDRKAGRLVAIQEQIEELYGVKWSSILKPWKESGKVILVCPPSDKSSHYFNVDAAKWTKEILAELKKYTKREVRIREKPEGRSNRLLKDAIQDDFDDGVFAVVAYNSIAATEAIIHGIPVFTLAPNAASPMGLSDLSKINNPIYPDREKWLKSLAYGQFSLSEMESGDAWRIVNESF